VPIEGPAEEELSIRYVFKGRNFLLPSARGRHFRDVVTGFQYMNRWVSTSGMAVEYTGGNWGFDARYRRPPSRKFEVKKGLTLEMSFFPDLPFEMLPGAASPRNPDGEWKISEDINLWLHAEKPKTFWYFYNALRALQLFFTVAARRLTMPLGVHVTGAFADVDFPEHLPATASLHFDLPLADTRDTPPYPHEFLFREGDADDRLGRMLRAWFRKFRKLEPSLLLYNVSCYSKLFLETQFLTRCQAIESYHRALREGRYMQEREFSLQIMKPLMAAVPADIDSDMARALRDRIRFANDFSLRTRLKQLALLHQRALLVRLDDPKSWVNEVVDARNAFTHPTSWPPGDVNYRRLPSLSRFLRLLLELSFLKEMGFTESELEHICARNPEYGADFRGEKSRAT